MLDAKQLKLQGLRYALTLQVVCRTAVTFSLDYNASGAQLDNSFDLLNTILKEIGQFTIGFVDDQIMLNNILTLPRGLSQLQNEFLKRGIGGIRFEAGLTKARYKRVIELIATPTTTLEQYGGIRSFYEQNVVEGVRFFPAPKNQRKNATGDVILETDSESYLLSKQFEDLKSREFTDSVNMLLESAGLEDSARLEVVAAMQARGVGTGNYTGIPHEVAVRAGLAGNFGEDAPLVAATAAQFGGPASGAAHVPQGSAQGVTAVSGGGSGVAATGSVGNPTGVGSGGMGPGSVANGNGNGAGLVSGNGSGGGGKGTGFGFGFGGIRGPGFGGDGLAPRGLMDVFNDAVEKALVDERGDPEKSYVALARLLKDLRPDLILSHFPAERQAELKSLPPDTLAAEFVEDVALRWAQKQFASKSNLPNRVLVDEQVVTVLVRCLQATHSAERLAHKLAQFERDYMLPTSIRQQIREELQWTALSAKQKHDKLLSTPKYDGLTFRRLLEHIKLLAKQEKLAEVAQLALQYFAVVDLPGSELPQEPLGRAPELLRAAIAARSRWSLQVIERLGKGLGRSDVSALVHLQIANCLGALAPMLATYEDFEQVDKIGSLLESCVEAHHTEEDHCCRATLKNLLPTTASERLVEIFLSEKDPAAAKKITSVLRRAGKSAAELLLKRLEAETSAGHRIALLKLLTKIGSSSIDLIRQRLADPRWYVVRNACLLLGDLQDPELLAQLKPVISHSDHRVQQAALQAVLKARLPWRAVFLAEGLPVLRTTLPEEALNELMFLKDPATLAPLEKFVSERKAPLDILKKAVQVIAVVGGDEALNALARIIKDRSAHLAVRQVAMRSLLQNKPEVGRSLLVDYIVKSSPDDPLVPECQQKLGLQRA